jgi:hypothetical protein
MAVHFMAWHGWLAAHAAQQQRSMQLMTILLGLYNSSTTVISQHNKLPQPSPADSAGLGLGLAGNHPEELHDTQM